MQGAAKTDNHDPQAKLDLRRYFLRLYHAAEPPHVLDCCQGEGLLWKTLRREFAVASYWGLDQKPKKGRLKIDSARVLAQPGWTQDVVDIDTYGVPWKHWLALLPHLTKPITVFLTVGRVVVMGGSPASRQELDATGLCLRQLRLPQAFGPVIARAALSTLLGAPRRHGLHIVEAREALSTGNARYFALRLEPD